MKLVESAKPGGFGQIVGQKNYFLYDFYQLLVHRKKTIGAHDAITRDRGDWRVLRGLTKPTIHHNTERLFCFLGTWI
jgi:hypothetical protein